MEKRAQTNMIIIVLIILIIIVAVIILWNIVIPLLEQRSDEASSGVSALAINLEVENVVLFVTGSSKISVRRHMGGGELGSLKFVFYDEDGKSHTEDKESSVSQGETEVYYFSPIPDFDRIERVSVFPVVGSSLGKEFGADAERIFELPAGLVSWWRFDDTENFVNTDNNGNLVGDVQISEGELILINGYFEIDEPVGLDFNNKFAISAWINPDLNQGSIINKASNYDVFLDSNGKIGFSGGDINALSFNSIDSGWNHIVVSIDLNGISKIYINNELVSYSEDFSGSLTINSDNVLIGQGFNGEIDEVMIFNQPLSGSQVDSLYNFLMK